MESKHPSVFDYSYFGTELHYAYNVFKVRNYESHKLEVSKKLFSKVLLASKYMNETKNDVEKRYAFKMKLMREMIKMGNYPRKSIIAVFYFIDYLLQLPEELRERFREEVRPFIQKEALEMRDVESLELSPTLAAILEIERREGKVEGVKEERLKIVSALVSEGFTDDYIAKLMELDLSEVKELRKTL